MKSNVKKLCNYIWSLEKEHQIFTDKAYGCAWHMVRMKVYYLIAMELDVFTNPHPYKRNLFWKLKYMAGALINSVYSFFLLFFSLNSNVIIVEHPRTKDYNGKKIDIYSYFYANKKINENKKVVIFSRTFNGFIEKNDSFRRISIDLVEISRSFFGLALERLFRKSKQENDFLNALERIGGKKIKTILVSARYEFLFTYYFYKWFFILFRRLDELVLVDGYSSRSGMIKAAKERGILVTELQHGVVTKYHLGYSYKKDAYKSECIPDKIFVWSKVWKENVLKFNPLLIDIFPNYYLTENVSKYLHKTKEKKSVVILSQGAVSEMLALEIVKNLKKFMNFKVYYKLHPSEYETWGQSDSLRTIAAQDNFIIVKDADLYKIFSECTYQVGVFSTALFEGLELGCQLILVDLPGKEYWEGWPQPYTFLDDWNI